MTMPRQAAILLVVPFLASCAAMSQKRDALHAQQGQEYIASLANAVAFKPSASCTIQGRLGGWIEFDITAATPRATMPSGAAAAPICIVIPDGAKSMTILSDPTGGPTYYQSLVAHPSTQFLGADHALIKDYPAPRNRVGQGLLNNFGLTGDYDLSKVLKPAKYVLVYVHPESLEGGIDVMDGLQKIWVPYHAYGHFRMKFASK